MEKSEIAIIGGGLGGLVAAHLFLRAGHDVRVYEQAPALSRIGAGIQLGPNVLKIMQRIGLQEKVEAMGSHPPSWISRNWDDGAILAEIPLNRRRDHYGAPYVTIHRGDLHILLATSLPENVLCLDKRLEAITRLPGGIGLEFANGSTTTTDIVIGADGVNSRVREILLGPEAPIYSGYVGHRSILPAAGLIERGIALDPCVKWWSHDRHMMIYFLDNAQKELYYVTGAPEPHWNAGVSFVPSSQDEMRRAFVGYHDTVQAIIDAGPVVTKWPLLTRPPLPLWSEGRIVLLGDASHPMKPHMAQGAAMAIEDAAMLARCMGAVASLDRHPEAFSLYQANRLERASRVQSVSNANTWLRTDEDPDWVYGYDVFNVPLVDASAMESG